ADQDDDVLDGRRGYHAIAVVGAPLCGGGDRGPQLSIEHRDERRSGDPLSSPGDHRLLPPRGPSRTSLERREREWRDGADSAHASRDIRVECDTEVTAR